MLPKIMFVTRMHSSRMRAARSSSRLLGGVYLSVGLETLSGVGLEIPPGVGLETPLGVGLETPPGQTPQLPPWVWAWRPARHAGIPPPPSGDLQGMLGYHLQCMLVYQPPYEQNDRQVQKYYLAPNFVCGR